MQSTRRRRPSLRSGFTIVELGVVIVIMGMMTYAVTVSFDAMVPGERLNTSVRNLAEMLRQARSEAVARNSEFFVEYDLDNGRYRMITPLRKDGGGLWIEGVDPEEERYASPWEDLRSGVAFQSLYLAGETYVTELVRVRFDPLGAASDHAVILTQPAYETTFTIEVLPLTGLIRFHEGQYERDAPQDRDFD